MLLDAKFKLFNFRSVESSAASMISIQLEERFKSTSWDKAERPARVEMSLQCRFKVIKMSGNPRLYSGSDCNVWSDWPIRARLGGGGTGGTGGGEWGGGSLLGVEEGCGCCGCSSGAGSDLIVLAGIDRTCKDRYMTFEQLLHPG